MKRQIDGENRGLMAVRDPEEYLEAVSLGHLLLFDWECIACIKKTIPPSVGSRLSSGMPGRIRDLGMFIECALVCSP